MMKDTIIKYWIEKAHEDIGSAFDNFSAGRLQNAVRDAYFACFHAVAALLIKEGQKGGQPSQGEPCQMHPCDGYRQKQTR